MADYNLDLDAIAPKIEHAKLNEEVIEVHPPRFKAIVELLQLQARWNEIVRQGDETGVTEVINLLRTRISELVPRLKDDDFDITVEQLSALMQFIFSMANPQAIEQAKNEIAQPAEPAEQTDTEKKTE